MAKNKIKKYRAGQDNRNQSKRIGIWIAVLLCALLIGLYFAVPALIRFFGREEKTEESDYHFYPVSEGEDITKDTVYMSLDRSFYYEDMANGITFSFDPEKLSDIPEDDKLPVSLLVNYIQYAIAGDSEKMNDLFSEKYEKEGYQLKGQFTPQKLYEIKFSHYQRDSIVEETGIWERWVFWVEYKIRKNNGTFRNDMGSDCTRKELFVMTYRDGTMEIDGITPYKIRPTAP